MATKEEAKAYREGLLDVGVGVGPLEAGSGSTIRKVVKAARHNPAVGVHGVSAEDALLCGLLESDDGSTLLVLPPRRDVFEAAIDFLRYESMKSGSKKTSDVLLSNASAINEQGVRSKILNAPAFKSGTTAISENVEDENAGEVAAKVTDGHKSQVIDCWAVHKAVFGGNGFRVTHRTLGVTIGGEFKKNAAMEVAKALASSRYPWRLLDVDVMSRPEWSVAVEFARSEFAKAKGVNAKATNPSTQTRLF